ncbi:DUF6776 family protein [Undibacterium sp. TJN19]|uniref:DUF6776 family protein n=1 Tax=Undibacterium sp. TJN19 TaxID=3413055 RepID=UPI003BF2BEA9
MSKSKLSKRRYLAPKMTITSEQSWPFKIAVAGIVIGIAAVVAWWTYDLGKSFAFGSKISGEQAELLNKKIEELTAERDKLSLSANTIESKVNIDRSTQKELTDQIKALTTENLKLKDDLAFFESLSPSAVGAEGISLQNFKVEMLAPGQLRYRALVMQGGKTGRDFNGEMQFNLNLVQAGKPATMLFPDPKTGDAGKLKLSFRHYQRLEGTISLPEGASVKGVQAKVLANGQIRAQQTVNL